MTQEEKLNLLTLWFLKDAGESVKSSDEVRALSYAEKWRLFRWLVNIRMPAPVDKAILDVQDDYLKTRIEEDGITDGDALPTMNSCGSQIPHSDQMSLWQGDITRLKVNAIVNAANSQMLGCLFLCIYVSTIASTPMPAYSFARPVLNKWRCFANNTVPIISSQRQFP